MARPSATPLARSALLGVLEAAALAPSSHNTQPWRFRLLDTTIELAADRTRSLPVNDPDDRELVISCGTALFSLRVAAAHAGWRAQVRELPSGERRSTLALIALTPGDPVAEEAALFDALALRRTSRKPFGLHSMPHELEGELGQACRSEGAWLQMVDDDERDDIAALIAEGDRLQFANRAWRAELAGWIRPRRAAEGLPAAGPAFLQRWLIRHLNLGPSVGRKDVRLVEEAPLLAVLGTTEDNRRDWLRAGQALQRTLLVAAQHDVQAGYLNQPCQVAALRPRLAALLNRDAPQLVLRFGRVPRAVRPHPRRRPVALASAP